MALGEAERVWTVADLLDAALATQPITPTTTAPDRIGGSGFGQLRGKGLGGLPIRPDVNEAERGF